MEMGEIKRGTIILAVGVLVTGVLTSIFFLTQAQSAEVALNRGEYKRAIELLLPRAQAGEAKAQNFLGSLYYLGLGVKKNDALASRWFLAAALQDNRDAQINIARHYQTGAGVKRDELRAYAWLRQARRNKSEMAERYMKWQAGSLILVPNQMQRAIELYGRLEDLVPSLEKGGL